MEKEKQTSSLLKLDVLKNGPILVDGKVTLKMPDGQEKVVEKPALCRCGGSSNKPFCDGTHNRIGFEG